MRAMSTPAPFQYAWPAMESTSTDPRYVGPAPHLAAGPADHDVFANIAAMTSKPPTKRAAATSSTHSTSVGPDSDRERIVHTGGSVSRRRQHPPRTKTRPSTRSHKISTELQAGDAQVISTRRTAHIHQDEDSKNETHPDIQKDARSGEINITGIGETEGAQ